MAAPKGFRFTAHTPEGERPFRVVYRKLSRWWGATDHVNRVVELHHPQSPLQLANVIVHEAAHVTTGWGADPRFEKLANDMAANVVAMLHGAGLLVTEDD